MHELSVATNIIESVQRSIPAEAQHAVQCIHIRLGAQAGVFSDSLRFSFDTLKNDAGFTNAFLHIEEVPFTIFCASCDKAIQDDSGLLVCPLCGGTDTGVVSGTELQIVDVELKD